MEQRELQQLFFSLLGTELTQTPLSPDREQQLCTALTVQAQQALYALSCAHDVGHIIARALERLPVSMDPACRQAFQKQKLFGVMRHTQMEYATEQVYNLLERERIPYIPLKGAVLRTYYPYPEMRTSCDIDILIPEEKVDCATDLFCAAGYELEKRNYHDVSLLTEGGIHLELHFHLMEKVPALDAVLSRAWTFAKQEAGCRFRFTDEFFLFYLYAHSAYHFLRGGCGIKSLLDFYIAEVKMGLPLSTSQELMKEAQIDIFAQKMRALCDICFLQAEVDSQTESLLVFLLDGGVYGSWRNHVRMRRQKRGNLFRYAMRRLFPPYRLLQHVYPVLKRAPFLLPFFWLYRPLEKLFTGKARRGVQELKMAQHVTMEETASLAELQAYLGLTNMTE